MSKTYNMYDDSTIGCWVVADDNLYFRHNESCDSAIFIAEYFEMGAYTTYTSVYLSDLKLNLKYRFKNLFEAMDYIEEQHQIATLMRL